MYDNLVKRLRDAARWADEGFVITPHLCLEAADALEKLSLSLIEVISITFPEIICQQLNTEPCEDYAGKDPVDATAFAHAEKKKPLTNADRIRAMTDEELAHLLHSAEEHLFTGNLWNYDKWTEWLKQSAEKGET